MKIDVIGFAKLDFVNSNGDPIKGTNIYYLEDIPSSYGKGKKAGKAFIKDGVDVSSLHVGVNSFDTDLKGRIISVN